MISEKLKRLTPLAVIVIIFFFLALFISNLYRGFYFSHNSPLLKIITQSQGVLIFGGHKGFYNVYPNKFLEKIYRFEPTDVEAYRVDEENDDSEWILLSSSDSARVMDEKISAYARNIVKLASAESYIKDPDVYKLYVLKGRYFFDVFDRSQTIDIIFEYVPIANEIKEVARVEGGNIEHIEWAE